LRPTVGTPPEARRTAAATAREVPDHIQRLTEKAALLKQAHNFHTEHMAPVEAAKEALKAQVSAALGSNDRIQIAAALATVKDSGHEPFDLGPKLGRQLQVPRVPILRASALASGLSCDDEGDVGSEAEELPCTGGERAAAS
jgi:hypothetical protein